MYVFFVKVRCGSANEDVRVSDNGTEASLVALLLYPGLIGIFHAAARWSTRQYNSREFAILRVGVAKCKCECSQVSCLCSRQFQPGVPPLQFLLRILWYREKWPSRSFPVASQSFHTPRAHVSGLIRHAWAQSCEGAIPRREDDD